MGKNPYLELAPTLVAGFRRVRLTSSVSVAEQMSMCCISNSELKIALEK
jgi:hypothetical protein